MSAIGSNAKVRQRHLLNVDYTQISDQEVPFDRYICPTVNAGIVHCAAGTSLTVTLKSQSEKTYVSRQPMGQPEFSLFTESSRGCCSISAKVRQPSIRKFSVGANVLLVK